MRRILICAAVVAAAPVDSVTRVADNYRKSNLLIGGKKRVCCSSVP